MRRRVVRSFAFLDLCGFTAFMDSRGDERALAELASLRASARTTAERHGVRVAKWLGDGLMLVGMDADAVLACAAEIDDGREVAELALRGGVSTGPVLIFEGDDYLGATINIAARLCYAAGAGEILVADAADQQTEPEVHGAPGRLQVRGIGRPVKVRSLSSTARHR